MTARAALAAASVAVAVVAAGCGGSSSPPPATTVSTPELGEVSTVPKGTPLDALELEGTDPVTGETVRLSDYAGTPIVLNFWASWCPPCRDELPALIELADANPGIQIVGINLEDAAGDAKALQQEIGFDWPSIADNDRAIASKLGVVGMPTTFFLDADHRIAGQIVGGSDLAGFEEGLLLATGAAG